MSVPMKAPRTDLKPQVKLTGTTKAAILFLCLGEKVGSELMKQLDNAEIERITHAMTRLGSIPAETVEQVLNEFTETASGGAASVVGSVTAAEALLRKFLPEAQVADILKNVRGPVREHNMWRRFNALNETVIANYLKGEHDQTAAAILNNVDTTVAAKVLPLLGPQRMYDVAERMINMEAVPLHMMRQIEDTLKKDIMSDATQASATEMQQRMADLFNKLDMQAFEQLAEELDTRIPDSFQAIKQRMFVFEDLVKLSAQDLAMVMRGADGDKLPLAMRGAKKEVRDHFLECLPQRSRQMLIDEMEMMGPVRGRDVRAAQSAMLAYAKDLADEGTIELPTHEDEDEILE